MGQSLEIFSPMQSFASSLEAKSKRQPNLLACLPEKMKPIIYKENDNFRCKIKAKTIIWCFRK